MRGSEWRHPAPGALVGARSAAALLCPEQQKRAAARARGKRLGRPRVFVDRARIASLRAQARSWAAISK